MKATWAAESESDERIFGLVSRQSIYVPGSMSRWKRALDTERGGARKRWRSIQQARSAEVTYLATEYSHYIIEEPFLWRLAGDLSHILLMYLRLLDG
jgi:hypothetical protein